MTWREPEQFLIDDLHPLVVATGQGANFHLQHLSQPMASVDDQAQVGLAAAASLLKRLSRVVDRAAKWMVI